MPARTGRLNAPSAQRNTEAIRSALENVLADVDLPGGQGRALELASGTGQHAVAFAAAFPQLHWQPSEADPLALASIAAWREHAGLANLAAPVAADLADADWPRAFEPGFDLIFASNLLHISPWEVTVSFLAGASRLLAPSGVALVYGCFRRDGDWISHSNRAFDESLRGRDPRWGVRDTRDVGETAAAAGLAVRAVLAMPANNTAMVLAHHSPSSS